jgi:dTMP kinase
MFKKSKRLERGLLISFEGLDGAGKQTHVNNTIEYLKDLGHKVHKVAFPDYDSPVGKVISAYLRGEYGDAKSVPHELVCVAYAADRAKFKDEIESYLENGYIVLADRYTYSNLFTAAKMPKEQREDFIKWIELIEFNEMHVVKPDHNVLLYVDPSVSIQRIEERGKREYQKGQEDIHENNKQLLIDAAETYYDLASSRDDWTIINQMKNGKQMSIDTISKMVKKEIDKILKGADIL